MYLSVVEVKPHEDYRLSLLFANGELRSFDMKPHLEFGIFRELKDIVLFNTVKVHFDTIEWANEADFDPEYLYEKSSLVLKI